MKRLAVFAVCLLTLMVVQGCTSFDQTPAGRESSSNTSESAPVTASSDHTQQPTGQADPAANGGSSLAASTPYQGSGAPVTQNVNPAPFLTASQPQDQAAGTATAPSETLTSRADGTMRGPNDLPAASTGWGSPAQPVSSGQTTKKPAKRP
jgi:hypothetical protein